MTELHQLKERFERSPCTVTAHAWLTLAERLREDGKISYADLWEIRRETRGYVKDYT